MEPISMIVGVTLLGVGYILGRARTRKSVTDPLDVRCPGCKHSLSYRDPETRACKKIIAVPKKYNEFGTVVAYQGAQCDCQNHLSSEQLTMEATWRPEIEK